MDNSIYIADLHKVGMNDIEQVGGKNASLGEMLQNLTQMKKYARSLTILNWMILNLYDVVVYRPGSF